MSTNTNDESKLELQSQLAALQNDVAELSATLQMGGCKPLAPTIANAFIKDVSSSSGGNSTQGLTASAPHASSFNEHISNSDGPALGENDLYVELPQGASTLLAQFARAQRALAAVTKQRDELLVEVGSLRQEKTDRERRSSSPNSDALSKMRDLYISLEKDHELLRLSLTSSERVRLQQKELIHLLHSHRMNGSSNGRSRRSQSPAPRRASRGGVGSMSPVRRSSVGPDGTVSSDILHSRASNGSNGAANKRNDNGAPLPPPPTSRGRERRGSGNGITSNVVKKVGVKGSVTGLRRPRQTSSKRFP